jgi:hypothetical protein
MRDPVSAGRGHGRLSTAGSGALAGRVANASSPFAAPPMKPETRKD